MEILETRIYRGANYWAPVPSIRFVRETEDFKERPTSMIPGLCANLSTTLPTLFGHGCAIGEPGGFFQQAREGMTLLHVAEHLALELQILAGQTVSYGKAHAA